MLRMQNLKFRRGQDVLLQDLNFVVHPGQRVAVAGRNGAGKSTLFQLILGELHPEDGELSFPQGWRIAHMLQEAAVTQRPGLAYVLDGHDELRRTQAKIENETHPAKLAELHSRLEDLNAYAAEARGAEILAGLGFAPADIHKPYAEFSGGWRIRLNLARALMTPCDLLLLDEPTNHLDLEAIIWLEHWLARFPGAVLLIAHDRAFLDNCTNHTLYLSGGSGRLYQGNYSSCEQQRAQQVAQDAAQQTKQAAKAAHIQKFVDRFRAKASKAKQVQSRIKALEKLQSSPALHFDSPYRVTFQNPDKASNPLISMRNVSLGYHGKAVLTQIGQSILPGDRIGVLGENGAGKSTLLKAMVGDISPLQGDFSKGQHCAIGYFAQHQLESLELTRTALSAITPVITKKLSQQATEQQVRDYLGGWGFSDQMITRPLATLSGGEKARFVLALLAADKPAILVLDEPTNHLDLDMRDALVMALQSYAGAVVIVSHDRSLLEKTIDNFWLVAGGRVTSFSGDLSDYTQLPQLQRLHKNGTTPTVAGASRKQLRQARAQQRQAAQAIQRRVNDLEKQLDTHTRQLAKIEAVLADTDTYQNMPTAELDTLLADAGRLRREVEALEEQWLTTSSELEAQLNAEQKSGH